MAIFPSYVDALVDGYGEGHSNIIERTEMDRGIPKQRRVQSDVLVTVSLNLLFSSNADATNFETWFYSDAQAGAAWFDWTDPRTGAVRQARAVGGTLGPLTPGVGDFSFLTRPLQIEYLRAL